MGFVGKHRSNKQKIAKRKIKYLDKTKVEEQKYTELVEN